MQYQIKHGFKLQSAGKLMMPGGYHFTDDEKEIAELDGFVKRGACVKVEPKAKVEMPAKKEEKEVPKEPSEDLTSVPGVGAGLEKKLIAADIKTVAALESYLNDASKTEAMKELLGNQYDKIVAHFKK